jgi:hypothetical protein
LAEVAKKHGIVITVGNIMYNENSFRCKIEGSVVEKNSTVKKVSVTHLTSILGSKFDETKLYVAPKLGIIKIVDYERSSYKYPVIVEQVQTKKQYKITVIQAKALLNHKTCLVSFVSKCLVCNNVS